VKDYSPAAVVRMRLEAGLSQVNAAKKIGTTRSYLCHVEHGDNGVSPEMLKKIARVYGCGIGDLLTRVATADEIAAALARLDQDHGVSYGSFAKMIMDQVELIREEEQE
jgi:transcriptional regulator with XRE-family HTH domain